jgi:hypothetical protein
MRPSSEYQSGRPGIHAEAVIADSAQPIVFMATRELMALELFRTPCSIVGFGEDSPVERLWANEDGPELLWPSGAAEFGPPVAGWLGEDPDSRIPVFAVVVPDAVAEPMLAAEGRDWLAIAGVVSVEGERLGSVWRCEDGSVFLPFDPDEVQRNLLSEGYRGILRRPGARDVRGAAIRLYYRLRRYMPKALQIWLRRRYAPIQARAAFPRWPIETGLHDLWEFLYSLLESIFEGPVPRIAAWPNGASWALVLTHDVETASGLEAIDSVSEVERSCGFRSCWNFVPRRDYEVSDERIGGLVADGFEVGVHGLHHDGRDLESLETMRERLPGMREAAFRWKAVGFRSPATQRRWELMPLLGFDYDSSYPDTDPFEPQGGGCCTWLPFFNDDMVELPPTLTQDHTLFVILRQRDERAWVEKAQFLRSRGGMALMVTHPDYLAERSRLDAYRQFLVHFSSDPGAWAALPGEVSAWWRRRAQSSLIWTGSAWRVIGPAAAEARVEFEPAKVDWLAVLGADPIDTGEPVPGGDGTMRRNIRLIVD